MPDLTPEEQLALYNAEMQANAEREANRLPYHYVCRIDDPLKVLKDGYTDFTVNGSYPDGAQFDTAVYKQMDGHPPAEAVQEVTLAPDQQMEAVFLQQSAIARAVFYPHKAGIMDAFRLGDLEAIQLMVSMVPIPDYVPEELHDDIEAARQELLALLPA